MRSAGNFSPEWGYLAPAPSMLRTVRVVLVATAVGATAGAAVVLSLVDRPTGDTDRVAVAAHAIVTSAQAAPAMESPKLSAVPITAPATADAKISPAIPPAAATANPAAPAKVTVAAPQVQAPQAQAPQVQAAVAQPSDPTQPIAAPAQPAASAQSAAANDANIAALQPAAVAALSDPAATDAPAVANDSAATATDNEFVGPQQPKKKHHTAGGYKDGFPDISGPLRRLFNARSSSNAYYPNRAY